MARADRSDFRFSGSPDQFGPLGEIRRESEARSIKEIRAKFQIDGRKYDLFIEKSFFRTKAYLFREEHEIYCKRLPVRVSVSTMKEEAEHHIQNLKRYIRKQMKKKCRKS